MKGWKTLLFGMGVAALGAAQAFDWATVIPQDKFWTGIAMTGIGSAIIWLRSVTTSAIGKPE